MIDELEKAQEQIGRLTFDIGCMKTELDAERKTNAEKIKLFANYLQKLIDLETSFPTGSDCASTLKHVLEYYEGAVAK